MKHLYIGRSYDTHHYFVKELRQKILHGKAGKNFRALDNDDKLKSKHARSGLPLRALVALSPAEHRSADFVFPAEVSAGTKKHSLKLFVVLKDALSNFSSRGYLDFPLLPFGLSSPVSD